MSAKSADPERGPKDVGRAGADTAAADGASNGRRLSRRGHFFVRLLGTIVVVALPLLALEAWTLFRELKTARETAYEEVAAKSARTTLTVEAAIDSAERLLKFVARHGEIRSLDPSRCAEFLRGLHGVNPLHAVVSVLDLSGQAYCISVPDSPAPRSAGKSDWFTRALASEGIFLGKPAIGRITQRPVVPLSLAVRDANGAKVAIVVVSIDLKELEQAMVGDWSASRGVLALVDKDFDFLVRSPDTTGWLGRRASNPVQSMRRGSPVGVIGAVGVDGVERIYAMTNLSKHQLRVAASIPTADVFLRVNAEIRHALIVASSALALAGLLAYLGARVLARPVRSLAASARAFAADGAAWADEALPGEFRDLAFEMNAMQTARRISEQKARSSEQRAVRLSRFYEARSRTNQAIVRLSTATDLYDTICALCVDTGQASMAWVGTIENLVLVPVAWGGRAKEYTKDMHLDLRPLAALAGGRFGASVLEGQSRVVNDYMNDPRTLPFRGNATPFGIMSSAIVPFFHGGVVVGTLNLYADQLAFFDEPLMRLLGEMAADVSFALDNFDNAAIHARTVAELAKREGQLSGIIESARDAIVTIDKGRRIRLFNTAASRMFGVAVDAALGQDLDSLLPDWSATAQALQLDTTGSAAPGTGTDANQPPCELIGRCGDEAAIPVEVNSFRTHDGLETLTTLIIRDISGARDAELARVAAATADAANRAKTGFLSRMSHELRTPLNAVLGFSQILREGGPDRFTESERNQLDLIYLAGAQLRALVDDVLDVSIVESGQLALSLSDVELVDLLDGVMRMSETGASQGRIRLVGNYAASRPVSLNTDPVRLRQVMLNLVSNAIKYNKPGGTVAIDIEVLPAGVRIGVTDTGMGMTPEQLAGLFEPFNRLGREHSAIDGTGIGMALVRQLVRLMGGALSVTSTAGAGTAVQVELSRNLCAMVTAAPVRLLVDAVNERSSTGSDPSGLVLYIEDNPVNVLVVKNMLRCWPQVQLVVAENGASGIRQAVLLRPDVVLLDMGLPDMSGLDVLKALRAGDSTKGLCVIALSASAMGGDVAVAKAAGAQDYWTKPIDLPSFRGGMSRALQRRKPTLAARPGAVLNSVF
ncbi:MAG: ATP-binding protein [Burkholderiales bacterium]